MGNRPGADTILALRMILIYSTRLVPRHPTTAAPLRLPDDVRLTPQRRAVLDAIEGWEGSFTIVELYDRARQSFPRLALATAYRTVELLRREGTVKPLATAEGATYIRCHAGHHHHLICRVCGAVEDTELCAAPSRSELQRRHGFAADSHEVDIYGTCARCAH